MDLQKGYRFGDDEKNEINLKIDGYVGPKTKRIISSLRRCANVDPFANNKVIDEDIGEIWKKQIISYYIGIQPGYLERKKTKDIIGSTFKQWSDATEGKIQFKSLDDKEKADIILSWTVGRTDDGILGFDGAGGILGAGGRLDKGKGKGFVNFDLGERWVYGYDKKEDMEITGTFYPCH